VLLIALILLLGERLARHGYKFVRAPECDGEGGLCVCRDRIAQQKGLK
jgi:hypothetical protein